MNSYAIIDSSAAPIISIQFTGNHGTDESFLKYLEETRSCYNSGQSIAIIFDATHAVMPSFKHQKMQAAWLKTNQNLMVQYCKGTAYVIPNAALRTVLKIIFSLQKQPVPYKVFGNVEDAQTWATLLIGK